MMAHPRQDHWAQWLLHRRFGGNHQQLKRMVERLSPIRDQVLEHARIREGESVLNVGCGDGLIAFGALDLVGEHGTVVFSDISQDLLNHCQTLAQQMQVLNRCQFLHASAQDLSALESQSVDVVTTRSVLMYVSERQQAFQHFYRVLRPNGRLSIYERINRFAFPEPPHRFLGYEVTPVMDLTQKSWLSTRYRIALRCLISTSVTCSRLPSKQAFQKCILNSRPASFQARERKMLKMGDNVGKPF